MLEEGIIRVKLNFFRPLFLPISIVINFFLNYYICNLILTWMYLQATRKQYFTWKRGFNRCHSGSNQSKHTCSYQEWNLTHLHESRTLISDLWTANSGVPVNNYKYQLSVPPYLYYIKVNNDIHDILLTCTKIKQLQQNTLCCTFDKAVVAVELIFAWFLNFWTFDHFLCNCQRWQNSICICLWPILVCYRSGRDMDSKFVTKHTPAY